jgi:hypothetical protein
MRNQIGPSNFEKRYESFRDDDGEWSFEIQEYQADLNLITPSDVPATLTPKEAYRVVVFLEGFIQKKRVQRSSRTVRLISSASLSPLGKLRP